MPAIGISSKDEGISISFSLPEYFVIIASPFEFRVYLNDPYTYSSDAPTDSSPISFVAISFLWNKSAFVVFILF